MAVFQATTVSLVKFFDQIHEVYIACGNLVDLVKKEVSIHRQLLLEVFTVVEDFSDALTYKKKSSISLTKSPDPQKK